MAKKWTVEFQDAQGKTLYAPIYDAENHDEAVRLARLEFLRHYSAEEINAWSVVQVRQGHGGLDIEDLESRFGAPKI